MRDDNQLVSDDDPRVQLAAERTLLAWIRTGLGLMAFGFLVARFALLLLTTGISVETQMILASTLMGCLLVLLGVAGNAGSAFYYRSYFRKLKSKTNGQTLAVGNFAVWIALVSAGLGIILMAYLIVVDIYWIMNV